MLQIRKSVFETNSSSSHALVYRSKNPSKIDEEKIQYYYLTKDGYIQVNFGQYHWTRETPIKNWHEKLNYLMTHLAQKILSNKSDPNYICKEGDLSFAADYLWNHYEDKDAQQRWDDACKILDESPEVQELKELFKKYCDCEFKGFKYCWWDDALNDWDVRRVFEGKRKNTINHKFWHTYDWKDRKDNNWINNDGYNHFSGFGSFDHQSYCDEYDLYSTIKSIGYETYLFSNDIMIIIDHDNH